MPPPLEDDSKPLGDVTETPVVSTTKVNSTADSKQDTSTDVTVLSETEKPSGLVIPAKTAATVPAAPQPKGAKLENQSTPVKPINKGTHGKGGFVHTLTANDGTKAQVYLSKSGAHAGIVFRNEISRGKIPNAFEEMRSRSVKTERENTIDASNLNVCT